MVGESGRLSGGADDDDVFYRNFQRLLAPLRENGANLWDLNLSDELTKLIADIQSWTDQESARLNTQQSQRRTQKRGEIDEEADLTDDVEGSVAKDCAKLTRESEMTRIATTVHGRQVDRFAEEFHDFYNYLCNDLGDGDEDGKLRGKRHRAQRRRQKFDQCNVDDIDCNDFEAVFKKIDCGLFDFLDAPPPRPEAEDEDIELPDLNGEGNIVPKNKTRTVLDVIRNDSASSAGGASNKARQKTVFDVHQLIPEVMIASLPIKKQHKLEVSIPVRIEDDGIHCGDVNDYKINCDGLPVYGFFSSAGAQAAELLAVKSQPKSQTASNIPVIVVNGEPATQDVSHFIEPFNEDINQNESMHVDPAPIDVLPVDADGEHSMPFKIPTEPHHPATIPDDESELISASRAGMRNPSNEAPIASDNERQEQQPSSMQLRARLSQQPISGNAAQQTNKNRSKKSKQAVTERISRLHELTAAGCWYTDNVSDDAEDRFLRQHIRYSDAERRQATMAGSKNKKVGGAFVKRIPPPRKPRRQHALLGLERFMWHSFDDNGNDNPPQSLVDTIYSGYNDSAFRSHMDFAQRVIEETDVARRQEQQHEEREKVIIAPWLLESLTEEQREEIMDEWRAAEMGNIDALNAAAASGGGSGRAGDNQASQESHVERFIREMMWDQHAINEDDEQQDEEPPVVRIVNNDAKQPNFNEFELGPVADLVNTSQLTEPGFNLNDTADHSQQPPQELPLDPLDPKSDDPVERALDEQRRHIIEEEMQDENYSADYDEWLKLVKLFVEHDKKLSSFDVEKVGAQLIDAFFEHDADGRKQIKNAVAARNRKQTGEEPSEQQQQQQLAFGDATANQTTPELAMNFVALMQQVFHGAASLQNVRESEEPQYAPTVVVKRGEPAAQNSKKNALRDLAQSLTATDGDEMDVEEDEADFNIEDA